MKKINIHGVIGYDVTSKKIIEELRAAKNGEIEIDVNSPGGSVFEGLAIYNAIKNYSGKTKIKVSGLAASMGSIIALAKGKFETAKSSVYMIHNAKGISLGDYREMEKTGKILNSVSNMLAKIYSENSGKDLKYVREKMDNETFYYGSDEIINEGYASISYDDGKDENKEDLKAMAELEIEDCNAKMNNYKESEETIAQICAMMNVNEYKKENYPVEKKTGENKNIGGKKMNFEELKANNPDLFKEVFQAGVEKERKRVSAHLKMAGTYKASMDVVSKFIADGSSIIEDDVLAEYLTAKTISEKNDMRAEDNPDGKTDTSGNESVDEKKEESEIKAELEAHFGIVGGAK